MLWICKACKTRYAVDAPACPHCGATVHITDHDEPDETEPAAAPADPMPADKTPPAK